MEWQTILTAFGVPVLSFALAYLGSRLSKQDERTRLKADVELLTALPDSSEAKTALAQSIDDRLWALAVGTSPRISAVPPQHVAKRVASQAALSGSNSFLLWGLIGASAWWAGTVLVRDIEAEPEFALLRAATSTIGWFALASLALAAVLGVLHLVIVFLPARRPSTQD
ncbi:hypothetical protein [Rhodococcus sp. IEGM1428]|uniref:hypothetical protein n=1 Tax=Rhodococcus sp. IEGM1428 TaxID=3392191 RepID=UPI003D0AB5EE